MRRKTHAGALAICFALSALVNWVWLEANTILFQQQELPPVERITYLDLQPMSPEAKPTPELPKLEPEKKREPKRKRLRPKKKLEPKKKLDFEELPKPEDEPNKEPEPEPEKPKEKIDFVLDQMKMVEQPDDVDEKDAPEDAEYLSNVNRDVREQTRAKLTNLIKDAKKQQAKPIERSKSQKKGVAKDSKIAQLKNEKSQLAKKAPKEKPSPEEKRPEQNDKPKSLLAMRELAPREHKMAQEAHEALANEAADGAMRREQKKQSSVKAREQQARIARNDSSYRFRITKNDLDATFGKEINAKKNVMSQQQSKQEGVWDNARAHWQSPLENMIPEVKVGNQTALRSRRHPFARYIATMHRAIHELWAWGFLDQLDTQNRRHPMNDYKLWSRVELVLLGDGTIDKVSTVKHSGNTSFDAAAREIVWAAGPFPNPPRQILSGNGKIYIHWAFHRDERACGTFGAQPFILDNAGQGDRPNPNVEVRSRRFGRRLARKGRAAAAAAPAGPEGPSRPKPAPGAKSPTPPSPPRSGAEHGPGDGHNHGVPGTEDEQAADPAAKKAANAWLHYLAEGKIDRLIAKSSVPFHAGETAIARTRDELKSVLQSMSEESREAGRPKGAKMYTAAGLRRLFGSVPTGVQEGRGRVYALTRIGTELIVLMLEKKFGSWRVVGVAR